MYREKELASLDELLHEVKVQESVLNAARVECDAKLPGIGFRGHAKSDWRLDTTLDRFSEDDFSLSGYNTELEKIYPYLDAYTSKKWELERSQTFSSFGHLELKNQTMMAYVRHHGFPSPLLDWTRSVYVALYFAFIDAKETDQVAVYSFTEQIERSKMGWEGTSEIQRVSRYIGGHKRAFLQQSFYTVCASYRSDIWWFDSHEEHFRKSTSKNQDLVTKFVLPGSLKSDVLTQLFKMNITPYSLFGGEDALLKTLSYLELEGSKFGVFN